MNIKDFGDKILTLAWIRCLMEEGVDFISTKTGKPESREIAILDDWANMRGEFVVPQANASPKGLEKNINEVLGNFLLTDSSPDMQAVLVSRDFKSYMRSKIDQIRTKEKV